MTDILLVCFSDGRLKELYAEGHAGYAQKGEDIVCAAESFLLRTAMDFLRGDEGISISEDASERGKLFFRVGGGSLVKDKLICTAGFLRCGLKRLAKEYPEYVHFNENIVEVSTED